MESSHPFGNAIRRGLEVVTHRVGQGVLRLRSLVPALEPAGEERAEFASMLADLGADAPDDDEATAQLRLAQVTIEELRTNLEQLHSLGDRFAEAEKARLELLEQLEQRRAEPTPRPEPDVRLARELASLHKQLEARDRRIARLDDRLARLRLRHDERHRVATERWHELRRLRRELREAGRDAPR